MTAHLAEESRLADLPELMPTLVRWTPPPDAPAHLAIGIERLEQAGRAETLLVVSPQRAPERLLDRVADARKAGAAIFALDQGDPELDALVHESLAIHPEQAPISFDAAQHLVSFAVADPDLVPTADELGELASWQQSSTGGLARTRLGAVAPPGWRGKLNRMLSAISGPPPG